MTFEIRKISRKDAKALRNALRLCVFARDILDFLRSISMWDRSRLRWIGLFAVFAMVALLTHAEGLYLAMHNDYSVWIRVARDWQSGLTLYEDAPDNKLPPLFLFIRLIDGPRPEVSLYLAESLLAVLWTFWMRTY